MEQGQYDELNDAQSSICAAHSALRNLAGIIETSMKEDDWYRYDDLSGDIYCIKHALQRFEAMIAAQGLKGDGIKWRI
jgi:hypothetical protein